MFKTLGEAIEYCRKFGLKVAPFATFEAAEALHRAFVAGQKSRLTTHAPDGAVCTCDEPTIKNDSMFCEFCEAPIPPRS